MFEQKRKGFSDLFGPILIDLARNVARGAIGGLLQRYSVKDLQYQVDHNTDLVAAAFDSPDPRDRQLMDTLRHYAARYSRYGPQIRATVTPDWVLEWCRKRYPEHTAVLDTPRGRVWFNDQFRRLLDYFFPP